MSASLHGRKKMVAKKFDLIGIMIRDPRDMALPEYGGQVVLEDPFSSKQILIRPGSISQAYKSYALRQENTVKETFLKAGSDFLELTTDQPFIKPLTNLFMKRARRLR